MLVHKFEENGIFGEIRNVRGREVSVIAYLKSHPETKLSEKYVCEYPIIFGFDNYDMEKITEIGDRLFDDLKFK